MKQGRPPEPQTKKKKNPVMVRMTDAEKADLDKLVELRNEDLKAENMTVRAPDVIRWLINKELKARTTAAA